ncbi:MAG: HAD family hydrolase [Planctomycetes bacterium]|nr:HAD family hydrolase [Planctomycetota bacterium]
MKCRAKPKTSSHKAAFLDRDGTVLEHVPYLNQPSQVRLTAGAAEAIRLFRQRGYLTIVITNQSAVARGMLDEATLAEIHRVMQAALRAESAEVDAIYYCPHHPEGPVAAYRKVCACRKPEPGLLLQAAAEHGIDLAASVMIGDSIADMQAGKRAGCTTILLGAKPEGVEGECVDMTAESLSEAARRVLAQELIRASSTCPPAKGVPAACGGSLGHPTSGPSPSDSGN